MVAYIRKRKATTTVYKGRVAKKPRMTTARVASIAKKAVMKASETKKHSVERIEEALSALGSIENQSLCNLAQGTGNINRIGHKVKSVGFEVRGHINNNTNSSTIIRMLVVRFKNNQAVPGTDLIEIDSGNTAVTSNDVSALWRRINRDSYDVLKEKYITLDSAEKSFKTFKFWVPFKKELTYETSSAVQPNHDRVHLVAFARSTGNDGLAPNCELHYISTFYFKDP